MQAVISGRSRVALLLEGEQLRSLHTGSSKIVDRREREIPYLLGDPTDLEFLEDVEVPEVARRLEVATAQADGLHLALMLLDPQLPPDVRRDAAAELAELLEIAGVRDYVEGVLLAHPLPGEADLAGALSCCPGRAATSRDLLLRVQALQSEVQDVFLAWEHIPDRVFEEERNRAFALATAVREGFFRKLVIRQAEQLPVDEFLVEALGNSTFSRACNSREILLEWLKPLQEPRSANPDGEDENFHWLSPLSRNAVRAGNLQEGWVQYGEEPAIDFYSLEEAIGKQYERVRTSRSVARKDPTASAVLHAELRKLRELQTIEANEMSRRWESNISLPMEEWNTALASAERVLGV